MAITRIDRPWAGAVLLFLAALIGAWTIRVGFHVDEAQALGLATLSDRGEMLYRDTFHHHFPLSIYVPAVAFRLLWPSLVIGRLSVLALTLGLSAWAMGVTRWYLAIGIAVLAFKIVGIHYFGGVVLYDNVAAPALFVVGTVTVALLLGRARPTFSTTAALAVSGAAAVLSTPVALLPVLLSPTALAGRRDLRKLAWRTLTLLGGAAIAYLAYLGARGGLEGFVEGGFAYNLAVIGPQLEIHPVAQWMDNLRLLELRRMLLRASWDPFLAIGGPRALDRWVFGGALFRLAVVVAAVHLMVRRRFLAAGFVFLFGTALNLRGTIHWHSNSLILFSFFAMALLLGGAGAAREDPKNRVVAGGVRAVDRLGRGAVALGFAWLMVRATLALGAIPEEELAGRHMDWVVDLADRVKALAGNEQEPLLLSLPYSDYQHLLTGFRAPGGYVFIDGLAATVLRPRFNAEWSEALAHPEEHPMIVVAPPNGEAFGRRLWEYFGPQLQQARERLAEVESGLLASPHLKRRWLAERSRLPETFYAEWEEAAGAFEVELLDLDLVGDPSHYVRVDVYPMRNPKVWERHDGWWDVDLERIEQPGFRLAFDDLDVVVDQGGAEPLRIANGRPDRFEEPGTRTCHVSLWRRVEEGLPQYVDGYRWVLPSWGAE